MCCSLAGSRPEGRLCRSDGLIEPPPLLRRDSSLAKEESFGAALFEREGPALLECEGGKVGRDLRAEGGEQRLEMAIESERKNGREKMGSNV